MQKSELIFMTINRRCLVRLGFALPLSALATAVMAQEGAKPEVKWSEAKPIIKEYVEKMSAASKQSTGIEFSEQKSQLVDSIMSRMEAQHIYAFIDP
jgi:hypothetical protein